MNLLFQCVVNGRAFVKKNGAKTNRFGGYRTTKNFREWERNAVKAVKRAMEEQNIQEPINEYVRTELRFFFKNRMAEPDCSNISEGIQDVLQKTGVLKDDKFIAPLFVDKEFGEDKGMPRVEVKIYKK